MSIHVIMIIETILKAIFVILVLTQADTDDHSNKKEGKKNEENVGEQGWFFPHTFN